MRKVAEYEISYKELGDFLGLPEGVEVVRVRESHGRVGHFMVAVRGEGLVDGVEDDGRCSMPGYRAAVVRPVPLHLDVPVEKGPSSYGIW